MSNTLVELTPKQLRQAASLKEKMASLQSQLNRLVGGGAAADATAKPGRKPGKKRRTMSAAARRRISLAMKKKWAARKAGAK